MSTPSPTTTLLSVVYDLTKALLEPRESSSSTSFIVNHTRVLLELANIFKQSLLLPTIERRDDIIEDDDDNREILTENEVFRTTGPILRYKKTTILAPYKIYMTMIQFECLTLVTQLEMILLNVLPQILILPILMIHFQGCEKKLVKKLSSKGD